MYYLEQIYQNYFLIFERIFDDIFIVTINEKKAKKNDVVDYYDFRNEKDKIVK